MVCRGFLRHDCSRQDHNIHHHQACLATILTPHRLPRLDFSQLRCFVSVPHYICKTMSSTISLTCSRNQVWSGPAHRRCPRRGPYKIFPGAYKLNTKKSPTCRMLTRPFEVLMGYDSRVQSVSDFQQTVDYFPVQACLCCGPCPENLLLLSHLSGHLWLLGILRLCLHVCSRPILLGRW